MLGSSSYAIAADAVGKLPAPSTQTVDFGRDIRPLFQKVCYSCHGPEKQEGGLRLDVKKRALDGGDSGRAFLPGKSDESRLIQLVAGLDQDTGRMPPDGEGTPLTPDQIALLRAWIDQGANWPDHIKGATTAADLWVLQPLNRPALPPVSATQWVINPIDHFILARLEREKITPSPPASRTTLMRRLYLDLLGLPPSPAEVAEYLADSNPDAYERLVDRLLGSPHFGERWGRHWLDLARYADSDGYEKDRPRPFAWRYRNWVLDSVNADLPFDTFTREQIAGDLLPHASLDQLVATGFHRNTLHNTEGGADPEEDRVKKTVDRTNTLGTVWLGLTVGCAQCHSHKYDPLTHREYYQLFAFFNNVDETDIDAPLEFQQLEYRHAKGAFDREHQPFLDAIKKYESEQMPTAQAEWEKSARVTGTVWATLDPSTARSRNGAVLKELKDFSLLASGTNKVSDVYEVEANLEKVPLRTIRAVRLEVLADKSLVQKGPGRADNGNFVLAEFQVEILSSDGTPTRIALTNARADHSQNDCDVSHAINGNPQDFWAVGGEIGKRHVAVFDVQQPTLLPEGAKLKFVLDQQYNQPTAPHNLGRFRLSITESPDPVTLDGIPKEVADGLAIELSKRTEAQAKAVTDYYRTIDPSLAKLTKEAANHLQKGPKPPDTKAQTVVHRSSEQRATKIHLRGDFLNPGESVEPRVPAWLPAIQARAAQPDRLDLARWLFDPANSITARVAANRVWEKAFGRGIVATVDDFGSQGEPPSHPELLDWLAVEFRESAWSSKELIRLIVTSNTYRQSSAVRSELVAKDPENILFARQSRKRVEAEIIRDLSLAASGLLEPRLGGPSVRPPQPAEYANLTYSNSVSWTESKAGDRYRRGMYTFFQRTSPYPMLMTFDSPDSNECCVQRETSNTPLQALTLWNDPAFFEFAQGLGRRIVLDVPADGNAQLTVQNRAKYAFTLCLGRSPVADELNEILSLYAAQLSVYGTNQSLAAGIIGKTKVPQNVAVEEVAAWTVVGRALLNLDEFITRE